MSISARGRQNLSKIDDLSDALEGGDERAAMDLVKSLPREGNDLFDSDAWRLAEKAIVQGWPNLAVAMINGSKAGSMDMEAALAIASEVDRLDSFEVLSAECDRFDLLRCAYKAKHARGGRPGGEVYGQALERAGRLRLEEWRGACQEGLASRWMARPKMAYELACERWGIPLWSANAAGSMAPESEGAFGAGRGSLDGVESMARHGSALGLPEETLLWSQADVESLAAEGARRGADPLWRADLLAPMLAGWEAARAYLPLAASLAQCIPGDASGRLAANFAKDVVGLGLRRWAPFMLAWSAHQPFGEKEAKAFEPVLRVCVVDASNVGLVAANIDYGSFNARMAVIAVAARQMGAMDDAATAVVGARLADLAGTPERAALFADPPFGAEMRQAWAFFHAESCRLEMGAELRTAHAKDVVRPRARGL